MDRTFYDGLSPEQFEELLLEWMTQGLAIPEDAAKFVFNQFVPSGLPDAERLEALAVISDDPDSLCDLYEELETYLPQFLALHLPDFVTASEPSIRVNSIQLKHELGLEDSQYKTFIEYLQSQGILKLVGDHRWGAPFETWYLSPDFMAEYQSLWYLVEDKESNSKPMIEQLAERLIFTEDLSHALENYLAVKPQFSGELLEDYKAVAEALGVVPVLVMDAEKRLMERREEHGVIEVTATMKSS